MSDVSLLRMIENIYAAATDPSKLSGLADEMQRAFASDIVMFYLIQGPLAKSTDLLLSGTASFEDWAHPAYTGYYRRFDVWSPPMLKHPSAVTHGMEVTDPSLLRRSQFYNDWCEKADFCRIITAKFPIGNDIAVINAGRHERGKDFTDADKQRLEILVPHLQRAVQIQQRLSAAEQAQALSLEMLEKLDLGILILDPHAHVLFANAVARRVLTSGADLTTQHGCVRPQRASQAGRFERTVRDAAYTSIGQGTRPGGFVVIERPEGAPLSLLISPYHAAPGNPGHEYGAALILFSDPAARADVPERAIAQMFGLSPALARLVSALVGGETMADYADAAGVTMNTAKTQLRQIFLKTGVNRQADLIRAVAANPLSRLARDGN